MYHCILKMARMIADHSAASGQAWRVHPASRPITCQGELRSPGDTVSAKSAVVAPPSRRLWVSMSPDCVSDRIDRIHKMQSGSGRNAIQVPFRGYAKTGLFLPPDDPHERRLRKKSVVCNRPAGFLAFLNQLVDGCCLTEDFRSLASDSSNTPSILLILSSDREPSELRELRRKLR